MSAFGQRGVALLKEIINHESDSLSAYNEELVRLVFNEVDEHHDQARAILQLSAAEQAAASQEGGEEGIAGAPSHAVAMVIHYEAIIRNKRLLLSYMLQRMERLKAVRWKHRQLPANVANMCCPQEVEFYRKYDQLLTRYMSKAGGIGLDLTLDVQPPRDNTVDVRVIKDAGTQLFSFGRLALHLGALVKLPADEAEPLIRSGVLELHDRSEFA